jgi:hypothetical protein
LTAAREFSLTGWVADRGFARAGATGHRITRLELEMPGASRVSVELGGRRPHVPEMLGKPGDAILEEAGFEIRGRLDRYLRSHDVIVLSAVCEHGARFVIDAGLAGQMIRRFDARLAQTPLRRRWETARLTYDHAGVGGLTRIAPRVAATEWKRLGRSLRARHAAKTAD